MDGKIKIIRFAILTGLILGFIFSCEDHRQDNLVPNKVYFNNSGKTNIVIYDFGLDFDYSIGVYKSGYWDENASLSVKTMSIGELSPSFIEENVKMIPDNLYTINNTSVQLEKENRNGNINITFYPGELYKTLSTGDQFVLPLKISSSNVEINAEKNSVYIFPKVVIPYISFLKSGFQKLYIDDKGESLIIEEFPIVINFENELDFTSHVEVAPDLLDKYNQTNGLSMQILPEASYSFESAQNIAKEQKTTSLEITLNKDEIELGKDYVLPLRIYSISQTESDKRKINIDSENNTVLLHADYFIPKLLNNPSWTVPYFSSQETQAGSRHAYNVLDGNFATSWHTKYTGGGPQGLPEHVIIDMQKEHIISQVDIYRSGGKFRDTKAGKIYTSIDNIEYTEISDWRFSDPDTDTNHTLECLQQIKRTNARYVKIEVTESFRPGNANITEVRVWGM